MENKKEQKILIGECKWRNQLKTVKEIQKLMSHASYLPGYDEYYFYFFSKAPYPEQARELEKIHENLVLVTIDDLFDEKIVTLHWMGWIQEVGDFYKSSLFLRIGCCLV